MPLLHRGPETSNRPLATEGEGDTVLVAAAQCDPRDFAPLFARYWQPVLGYCSSRLLDRQDAEDAASQVFVDAYAGLHRFRQRSGEGSFRAWLFTIAHHEVANRRRYRLRHPASSLAVADEVLDRADSPEHAAIAASDAAQVHALVRALPARCRDVVELRLAGLTDREIASVLGISGAAVRQAQSRAVSRLRLEMGVAPHQRTRPSRKRTTDD